MFPVLFEIGPIKIYSFGLMMGLAFIVANYLLVQEFRRRNLDENAAGTITLIALIAGVIGSKLFSVFENWDRFVADPAGELFSASGLTFYGGLIVATLCIWLYVRSKKIPFARVADAAAPSLIIAYGIGRIGCQLSGDGDYGIPTDIAFAMTYPEGTVSTLAAKNPGLVEQFREVFPGRPVPLDIPVHPAPVYETLAALAIFAALWALRKRPMPAGMLFGVYLILAGIERLLVEFIRLNPTYLGLSQAQWISVGMIVLGSMLCWTIRSQPNVTFEPVTARGRRAPVAKRTQTAR